MARLDYAEHTLILRLTLFERFTGFTGGDGRIPFTAVRQVRIAEKPWRELRGRRWPGIRLPGRAVGTWKWELGRDFVSLRGRGPAVVIELIGVEYSRLLVSDPFAEQTAAELSDALRASYT
jgi:hypothetical protein